MKRLRIQTQRGKDGKRGGWRVFWPIWLLFSLLIGLFGFNLLEPYLEDLPRRSDVPVIALGAGKDLQISQNSLQRGEIHLFDAANAAQRIQFLVQRANDNVIHTAIATCRSCIRSGKAHYARNGEFICGQCEHAMRFEISKSNEHSENCIMPEIPHSVSNGMVIIRASDVRAIFDRASQ